MAMTDVREKTLVEVPQFTLIQRGTVRGKEMLVETPGYSYTVKSIYQLFYKETSAVDRGSLYQLRNLINRRDVSGPKDVTQKFRPHQHFIEDVTDAYVVTAFLELMDSEHDNDLKQKLPVFSIMNDEQKKDWINEVSAKILDKLHLREIDNFKQL